MRSTNKLPFLENVPEEQQTFWISMIMGALTKSTGVPEKQSEEKILLSDENQKKVI